jgi:CheY-like chemotaxis protein
MLQSESYQLVLCQRAGRKSDFVPHCPVIIFKPAFAWDNGQFHQDPPCWNFVLGVLSDLLHRHFEGQGKRRAVVMDDERAVRKALKAMLERFGFEVTTMSERQPEMEIFQDQSIELLIMDLKMPGISWEEYATAVAATSPNTLQFLATGDRQTETDAPIAGVIYKPFGLEEIAEVTARVLKLPLPGSNTN